MRSVKFYALFVALASLTSPLQAAASPTRTTNQEFGFSARFPAGLEICESFSGPHLQGYYVSLRPGESCKDSAYKTSAPGRYISMVASFNSSFSPGLVGIKPDGCRPLQTKEERRLGLNRVEIAGLRSVSCIMKGKGGTTAITIGTRFGRSAFLTGREARASRVNLLVNLGTDNIHLRRDFSTFRDFVSSVRTSD